MKFVVELTVGLPSTRAIASAAGHATAAANRRRGERSIYELDRAQVRSDGSTVYTGGSLFRGTARQNWASKRYGR